MRRKILAGQKGCREMPGGVLVHPVLLDEGRIGSGFLDRRRDDALQPTVERLAKAGAAAQFAIDPPNAPLRAATPASACWRPGRDRHRDGA